MAVMAKMVRRMLADRSSDKHGRRSTPPCCTIAKIGRQRHGTQELSRSSSGYLFLSAPPLALPPPRSSGPSFLFLKTNSLSFCDAPFSALLGGMEAASSRALQPVLFYVIKYFLPPFPMPFSALLGGMEAASRLVLLRHAPVLFTGDSKLVINQVRLVD